MGCAARYGVDVQVGAGWAAPREPQPLMIHAMQPPLSSEQSEV